MYESSVQHRTRTLNYEKDVSKWVRMTLKTGNFIILLTLPSSFRGTRNQSPRLIVICSLHESYFGIFSNYSERHRVVYFSWNNETYLVTKIRLKHHSNHLLRGISRRNIKESLQPYRLFSPPLWRTTTYQTSCELTLSPPLVLGTRWLIWRKDETRWNIWQRFHIKSIIG